MVAKQTWTAREVLFPRRSSGGYHPGNQFAAMADGDADHPACALFPPTESYLHPAVIEFFLIVHVCLARPGFSAMDAMLNAAASGYCERLGDMVFAVCRFFQPDERMRAWEFGNLCPLWSPKFMPLNGLATSEQLAGCLVPLNRIASKFIPAVFAAAEFPSSEYKEQSAPMVILTMPPRGV